MEGLLRHCHPIYCLKSADSGWSKTRKHIKLAIRLAVIEMHLHCTGSPYSITERILGSGADPGSWQSACSKMSHKPGGRLPLLSARRAFTAAALKRAATNFAAW